jgi:nucleotide-binding universal stress UspA family protein
MEKTPMDWARVMAPLTGGDADAALIACAASLAEPFGAELTGVHAPPDVADLIPWMGDGFMGGVQTTAVDSIRQAAVEGATAAKAALEACPYARKTFCTLKSPVWAGLAQQARLSDVVVFADTAAKGKGPLGEIFQQVLADEQRPTVVARPGLKVGGVVAVAWDGGKEASRAVRTAVPLLEKASSVLILSAPAASARLFDPEDLRAYLASRGVAADIETIAEAGDPSQRLLKAAKAAGADLLVSGAFGHPRLQEFIFGGTTRTFLNTEGPSLFLSH